VVFTLAQVDDGGLIAASVTAIDVALPNRLGSRLL
jgi:hypothetical protein